jgi:hypothetical protein
MKTRPYLLVLSLLIAALSLAAALAGVLWQGNAAEGHYTITTPRGQSVEIWGGSGLYRLDATAGASQEIAQDFVTLFIGIPLLVAAVILAWRGSMRGKVLLTGTLGYFLYTYTSMSMLTAYNELFLLYVALMSLSLFTFTASLMSFDLNSLPAYFTPTFPRRIIAGFSLFLGAMLALLWLKLIVPPLFEGTTPDGLYSYTTLVIQALDLGIIAPAATLTGILLLRRAPLGYLLCSVVLILTFSMGAALLAMIVGQMLAEVQVDLAAGVIFSVLAISGMSLAVWMLGSITQAASIELPSAHLPGINNTRPAFGLPALNVEITRARVPQIDMNPDKSNEQTPASHTAARGC